MTKSYLFVKQGCISRWQYDSFNAEVNEYGFFTENFYNCVVVILRDKKAKRLVMMHADNNVTLNNLLEEIAWVGKDCEKYIYYKENNDAKETLDDIFNGNALRNKFSFILIKILRDGLGRKVLDDRLMKLPNGTMLYAFEAAAVYADLDQRIASEFYLEGKKHIIDDKDIQSIYLKSQKNEYCTFANKSGDNPESAEFREYESKRQNMRASSFAFNSLFKENKSEFPKSLLTKYKLPNAEQESLEKGLRNAAFNNLIEDLKEFIKHVKNIDARDSKPGSYMSALHRAAEKKHDACCALLLNAGANMNLFNANGLTPLDLYPALKNNILKVSRPGLL